MSTAILTLSETGKLQEIHDKWLRQKACTSQSPENVSDRLQFESFLGLFLLSGIACFLALFIYFCLIIRQFIRRFPQDTIPSSNGSSALARIQMFLSFMDEKEGRWKNKLKRKRVYMSSSSSDSMGLWLWQDMFKEILNTSLHSFSLRITVKPLFNEWLHHIVVNMDVKAVI